MEIKLESKIRDVSSIIEIILSAENLSAILNTDEIESLDQEYQYILNLITNSEFESVGAAAKLKTLRDLHQINVKIVDLAGTFTSNGYKNIHQGNKWLLNNSKNIYQKLKNTKTRGYKNFIKYLPESIEEMDNGEQIVHLGCRGIPLLNLKFDTDQVIYIFGELLKFIKWMNDSGYYHLSLAPENIFFIPQTQSIKIGSFYQSIEIKERHIPILNTNNLYHDWVLREYYPMSMIPENNRSRIELYDLYSIKATAASLMKNKFGETASNNPLQYYLYLNNHNSNNDALKQFKKLFKDKNYTKIIL